MDLTRPFAVFDRQDSGCWSCGIEHEGRRLFVKEARTSAAAASLRRAVAFHAAVRHPVIVAPLEVTETGSGLRLVYPWHDGRVLNAATVDGSDRSGLERFTSLPVAEAERAITAILEAHRVVADAGFVAVDLYDGCFLYDFDARQMRLIDLDEYRPGPFAVEGDRLPGSLRYLAPEELERGGLIDQRTTVFGLGRVVQHLLAGDGRWRGSERRAQVARRATRADPGERWPSVAALVDAWSVAGSEAVG